jgi:hypothetical protein
MAPKHRFALSRQATHCAVRSAAGIFAIEDTDCFTFNQKLLICNATYN